MNDCGKSDSRVVPAKLANKTGQPVAELVEERRLAKGNAVQQNASRTQGRDVDASSALERVRRVARQDRKARFTALLHHVTLGLLGAKPEGRCGCGWRDVGCLRAGPGGQSPGSARPGAPRRLPGEAIAEGVHTEGGRAAAAAWHCQPGGQDPPAGCRRGAQRCLRGGLPRFLVRVPAWARAARRTGCAGGRDREEEGELDTRRRHSWLL